METARSTPSPAAESQSPQPEEAPTAFTPTPAPSASTPAAAFTPAHSVSTPAPAPASYIDDGDNDDDNDGLPPILPLLPGALPLGTRRPQIHTKHLTTEERQRVRTLYFDGGLGPADIMNVTGYTMSQVRTATRAESAIVKPRTGRPRKLGPQTLEETRKRSRFWKSARPPRLAAPVEGTQPATTTATIAAASPVRNSNRSSGSSRSSSSSSNNNATSGYGAKMQQPAAVMAEMPPPPPPLRKVHLVWEQGGPETDGPVPSMTPRLVGVFANSGHAWKKVGDLQQAQQYSGVSNPLHSFWVQDQEVIYGG